MKTDKLKTSAACVLENLAEEITVRETELAQLRTTQTALKELYGVAPTEPVNTDIMVAVQTPKPAKVKTGLAAKPLDVRAAKPAPGAPAEEKTRGAEVRKYYVAMRHAAQPFTAASLRVSIGGEDPKQASNAVTAAAGKGWIKRVGPGEYERTGEFPAEL